MGAIGEQPCPANPGDRTTVPIAKPGLGTDWYTTAWFDKYLRHDPAADARLLTERWRADPIEAGVDPNHDGNGFSFYYNSRLDVHLFTGGGFDCEELRADCSGMVPASGDGYPGTYSYIGIDTTADATSGPGAAITPASSLTPCTSRNATRIRLRRWRGRPITKAKIYVDGHRVRTLRRRPLRSVTIPALPGSARHTIRIDTFAGGRRARRITRHVYGCSRALR